MSRSVLHSKNVGHRQLWRSLGGYSQSGQFAQECARSEATVKSLSFLSDLRGHEGCVNVIVFNPSGDLLASGSDDGKVRLWNPYTFQCLRTMKCVIRPLSNVASPNGDFFAHQSNVFSAEFLPFNDQHLASGGNDAELKYYNLETEEGTVYSHHTRKVLRMTVHPDHPYCFMSCSADGTVRMIDTRQQYESATSGPIETVQGRLGDIVPQALGGGRGMRPTGATPARASLVLSYRSRGSSPQLYSVDFNPMNGQQFIVGSDKGDVRLFDLRQIRDHSPCSCINIYTNKIGGIDDITGCVFSRDGRKIVGTALSDAIYTWKTDCNWEKENDFPLCLKGGFASREPCDHSGHAYTPSMIARFHDWESSRAKQRRRARGGSRGMFGVRNQLDDEDDLGDDTDESSEIEDGGEDDGHPSNDTSVTEDDDSEERETSHHHMDVSEDQEAGEDDEDDGEGEEGERGGRRGMPMPNLRDLLGAWPILTGEGGNITIDIETFLRVAANVSRDRHPRRRHRAAPPHTDTASQTSPAQASTQQQATTSPSTSTSASTSSQPVATESPSSSSSQAHIAATTDTTSAESSSSINAAEDTPANAKRDAKSSPHGPLRSTTDDESQGISSSPPHQTSQQPPTVSSSSEPLGSLSSTSETGRQDSTGKPKEKDEETKSGGLELPHTYLQRFTGHASIQTIKGVNFWGPNSEFVVSGSDDANVFVWDAETTELINILVGHDDVVNCVVGHPRLPIIATSGIDDVIKLWEPIGPSPSAETIKERIRDITGANANNRRFDRGIQCAQQ